MVTRLVFVKLKDQATRPQVAEAARQAFAQIAVVRSSEVLEPADANAEVWDLCFRVLFDSIEDVPTYIDDPAHVAFVDNVLTPAADVKKGWNFKA
ncbi:MAG: Dabb family protein [Myxococcota bacterium]